MSSCLCPNPYLTERSVIFFPHLDNHPPSKSLPIPSRCQTTFNIPAHDIFNFGSSLSQIQKDQSLSDAESFTR